MKNSKSDVRSRFTQTVIKKSLLKLICDKPLKSITVAELCREAEITRGTFYNHFYDIYDVYESIENEFIEQFTRKLDGIKTYALEYDFFYEIMTFLERNSDVTSIIVSNPGESSLLKRLISYVRDKYIADFSERFPRLDLSTIENIFVYSSNGSVSVMLEWFKNGKPLSTDKMAHLIGQFNKIIINGCNTLQNNTEE